MPQFTNELNKCKFCVKFSIQMETVTVYVNSDVIKIGFNNF